MTNTLAYGNLAFTTLGQAISPDLGPAMWMAGVLVGVKIASDIIFKVQDRRASSRPAGGGQCSAGEQVGKLFDMHNVEDRDQAGRYEWWCKWSKEDREQAKELREGQAALVKAVKELIREIRTDRERQRPGV